MVGRNLTLLRSALFTPLGPVAVIHRQASASRPLSTGRGARKRSHPYGAISVIIWPPDDTIPSTSILVKRFWAPRRRYWSIRRDFRS